MKHSKGFEALVASIKPHISEITIEEFLQKREAKDQFSLIDVREDNEWQAGFIEEATHLGRGILERDIEKRFPDPKSCLVLYCGGGYRSALACDSLQKMGYQNVHSLAGGFRGWQERSFPVCKE